MVDQVKLTCPLFGRTVRIVGVAGLGGPVWTRRIALFFRSATSNPLFAMSSASPIGELNFAVAALPSWKPHSLGFRPKSRLHNLWRHKPWTGYSSPDGWSYSVCR